MHHISFLELLKIDYRKYKAIAVVGGGGKTTLIHRLTDELLEKDKKVIITTTTHMAYEPFCPFVKDGETEKLKKFLDKYGYVIAADYDEEAGKYCALSNEKLEQMKECCDVLLIEADGARHMPLKVPALWEPAIPECADIVISVIGLDCLEKPISQSAFRMELTSKFLKKNLDAPVTEEDIVKIATSICGLFKDVEERAYRVYLNKTDLLTEEIPAQHIVEELEKRHTIAAYGSLKEETD
ncbi:MAG: selenium cofactor biosynthesis protein YqeC [Blautia sp.]|nr:selenium cofactor biosynthesis protein YqeC [Blautia sp.]